MKKKIVGLLFLFIFCFGIISVKAVKKSIDYDVVVKDANGVVLNGSYKDENGQDKIIKVTIPFNEKITVLHERYENGVVLGHVKYTTEIVLRNSNDTSSNTGTAGLDSGTVGLDSGTVGIGSTTDPSQELGNYNNQESSTGIRENGNYNNNENTTNTWVKPTNPDNSSLNNTNKYTETKKKVEVEGDIDLSKCKVEKDFSLSDAIKFNKEKKLIIVNPKGVNLYKGPALAYEKVTTLDPLVVVKYSYGAVPADEKGEKTYWIYTEKDKNKGWLYNDLDKSDFANYKKGRILVFDDIDVYKFPFVDSTKMVKLEKNIRKSFTYIYGTQDKNNDSFYFIKFENKRGWVKNVAIGINAEIKITAKKGVKIYRSPNLNSKTYNIILPNGLKIKSIYKYSKENDAFYIEINGKKGWIILEDENNNPNFEVKYLKDDVEDPLLDKPAGYEEKTSKNHTATIVIVIVIVIVLIIIVSLSLFIYIKFKRKKANDFSVSNSNNNSI